MMESVFLEVAAHALIVGMPLWFRLSCNISYEEASTQLLCFRECGSTYVTYTQCWRAWFATMLTSMSK